MSRCPQVLDAHRAGTDESDQKEQLVISNEHEISQSEEADDYRAIVVRLNERWRVIACSAGIQWILQRAVGKRHGERVGRLRASAGPGRL
jgi:hypothetical protein